jgi:hypothetical protein
MPSKLATRCPGKQALALQANWSVALTNIFVANLIVQTVRRSLRRFQISNGLPDMNDEHGRAEGVHFADLWPLGPKARARKRVCSNTPPNHLTMTIFCADQLCS